MGNQDKHWILALLLLGFFEPCLGAGNQQVTCDSAAEGTFHDYGATTLNGSQYISFSKYRGKTILVVNVASYYLNALHNDLKDYGFIVLGFPCNQFGKQEPGDNSELLATLKHVRPGNGFVPDFEIFQKGDVNGQKEQSVFTFLKNACPPVGDSFGNPTNRLFWEPLKVNDIKWNFEKFLVGPNGRVVKRWYPRVSVPVVRKDITDYLRAQRKTQKPSWTWSDY
ncbi:GPX3 peroxidase, partial [Atractosteus spatula]|nr:GPX3 peroxidase [Atractosteus spatula]